MADFHDYAMLPSEEAPCVYEVRTPHQASLEGIADPKLEGEGWQRRFMADAERLAEYVELYTALGLEVKTEKVLPDEVSSECADCRLVICRQFVTIYTRQSRAEGKETGYRKT